MMMTKKHVAQQESGYGEEEKGMYANLIQELLVEDTIYKDIQGDDENELRII